MAREKALVNSAEYLLIKAGAGLPDVKVSIIDVSDDSSELTSTAMTEVNSGLYKYSHTFTSTGTYLVKYSSASGGWESYDVYEVVGAVSTSESAVTTYCDKEDVARILGIMKSGSRLTFSATSLPTADEVNEMIEEASDEIDKITKHAWREVTVTDELYDYFPPRFSSYNRGYSNVEHRSIHFNHRKLKTLDTGEGDKIYLWTGTEWDDIITSYTEGRADDFWLDYNKGIIFFKGVNPSRQKNAMKATYRFGEATVPTDIRKCCAKMVAMELSLTSDFSNVVPDGGGDLLSKRATIWQKDIDRILGEYKEFLII